MPRDSHAIAPLEFINALGWDDLPAPVRLQAELAVIDLIGVGWGGSTLPLSRAIRDHAAAEFGAGGNAVPMPFDGRPVSATGAALAGGMTIDALDAHDGFNPAKGHVGCGLLPGALALAQAHGMDDGQDFLTGIVLGYELGSRLATALHGTVKDYHTSGAWVAVAVAAVGARFAGLDTDQLRHALGIAEYHGPRSQMMRCIDHPTMLKDGSGWGAMAGASAVSLARAGFTGAPAITVERADAAAHWADLGGRFLIMEQYFKPYPVCRWAQAPIEGVLHLVREHGLTSADVDHIEVRSFHESIRLATNDPKTTEEAQYSTSFPCAAALVRGRIGPEEVTEAAFADPEIRRISLGLRMVEDDACNATFPAQRHARVKLHLKDGRVVESPTMSPRWTREVPPTEAELRAKFHDLADPVIGRARADRTEEAVAGLASGKGVAALTKALCAPA